MEMVSVTLMTFKKKIPKLKQLIKRMRQMNKSKMIEKMVLATLMTFKNKNQTSTAIIKPKLFLINRTVRMKKMGLVTSMIFKSQRHQNRLILKLIRPKPNKIHLINNKMMMMRMASVISTIFKKPRKANRNQNPKSNRPNLSWKLQSLLLHRPKCDSKLKLTLLKLRSCLSLHCSLYFPIVWCSRITCCDWSIRTYKTRWSWMQRQLRIPRSCFKLRILRTSKWIISLFWMTSPM